MITVDRILDVERYLDGVDVVLFDLDDTLYSEKQYVCSGFHAVAKSFPEIPNIADELWNAFCDGKPAIDTVLARYGQTDRKAEALERYRLHEPEIDLYPGVTEMLDRIGKTKKIGIITDGRPEGQEAKCRALGLCCKTIITDALGGAEYRKPCPEAFERMQKFFGIPFSRMVYIGDNPNKDFIAPEALGMQTIWFRNPDGLYSRTGTN